MTHNRWKDVFEGIGLMAIIASLIFLGIETKNGALQAELNTQALEISAYQELIGSINRQNDFLIAHPDFRAAWKKVVIGTVDEPTQDERTQVGLFLFTRFRHGDMAYFQYERGAIDESRMKSAISPVIVLFEHQFVIDWWNRVNGNFVAPYRNYIDRLIDETDADKNLSQNNPK